MKITKYKKSIRVAYIQAVLAVAFIWLFFMEGYIPFENAGNNLFHVTVNGVDVGSVSSEEEAEELLIDARRAVAFQSDELVFMDKIEMSVQGEEILRGYVDDRDQVYQSMIKVLEGCVLETKQHAYTVKVDEYMVNLGDSTQVQSLLEAAIGKYDTTDEFDIALVQDSGRALNVLQAEVVSKVEKQEEEVKSVEQSTFLEAGITAQMSQMFLELQEQEALTFDDFDLGISNMSFNKEIEIVEAYLPVEQLSNVDEAVAALIEEQEVQQIYKVKSGDTLSEISIEVNIPMDDIIAMNDSLEDENTMLHIDQELIITVPEPELSVVRKEVNYYEEVYNADIVYVDNDSWYTTKSVVLQEPSAGFRKVIAEEVYVGDSQTERNILLEEVVMEAVPKIVERGTKIPPTYIKPINGGRLSSKFGKRSAPTAGASTYHKGVDWAVSKGTSVYASSGGTVTKAGWGSSYGYVVYINHGNGTETRYAHLSKVLVSKGQKVKQGEIIAKSGNTGRSTGPHLHFEIRIDGTPVNPLKYVK
ncbi:MAG: peptidoglycan DD-metalloendopeptidase family protein [Lachnospiraceae bacterium]|nr:peptidoglycan DD-metalloendopeptidase family protein [Lachnospiraceae bacterium]